MVIVTKDADFSTKVLVKGAPPKVVHFKFGNLRMRDFHKLLIKLWPEIEGTIAENSLVNIFQDRIEVIK